MHDANTGASLAVAWQQLQQVVDMIRVCRCCGCSSSSSCPHSSQLAPAAATTLVVADLLLWQQECLIGAVCVLLHLQLEGLQLQAMVWPLGLFKLAAVLTLHLLVLAVLLVARLLVAMLLLLITPGLAVLLVVLPPAVRGVGCADTRPIKRRPVF